MKFVKIVTKVAIFSLLICLIFCLGFGVYCLVLTKDAHLSVEKLQTSTQKIIFCDASGAEVNSGYLNGSLPLKKEEIPKNLKNAFIAIEDKRFYKHNGLDGKRIVGAAINNIKSGSYREGASTITQQLIKNTHLNSQKTIKRKLSEMKLSLALEKKYTKEEIITMYLNQIYFGENCYGVGAASLRYFNKDVNDLTVEQCATLAAIIKAPAHYSPITNAEKCKNRRDIVLKEMYLQGYIDEKTFQNAIQKPISVCAEEDDFAKDYLKEVINEVSEILPFPVFSYGKEIRIYTGLELENQKILEELDFAHPENTVFSAINLNNESGLVSAFRSNTGQAKRQCGSTIKPFAVYGPAIECDFMDESTLILDEPVSYSGYQPKNYGNTYHGYVSAKYALSHSLNVPAVKILDGIGVEKAENTLRKLNFSITDQDNSLPLALGATQKGVTLKTIANAYGAIASAGEFEKTAFISQILADGKPIYKKEKSKKRVFSEETAFLLTDMLSDCVKTGTAKKLSHLSFPVAAKTGTVGSTTGNTDAYTLSYTQKYVLGVWFGAKNKEMSNTVTGGALPATLSMEIWQELAKHTAVGSMQEKPSGIERVALHKSTYENEQREILSHEADKETEKLYSYFKKKRIPTVKKCVNTPLNSEFLSLNHSFDSVCIVLCVKEYGNFYLMRQEIDNNTPLPPEHLCNLTQGTNQTITDHGFLPGKTYRYLLIRESELSRIHEPDANILYSQPITIPYQF